MFSSIRRQLSYANVVATVALLFAMSGGALAASRYLINSTKQINPKVIKKLKGNAGAPGAGGKEGPPGRDGAQGREGSQGKEGPAGMGPAFSVFHNVGINEITSTEAGNPTVVATLGNIPAAKYVILAKLYVFDATGVPVKVICKLVAEGDTDQVVNDLGSSLEVAPFPLQVVHQFNSTGSATVACYLGAFATKVYADYIRITAIQVSALTNTEV
ncbi:MAG TPA: hypothetical protein VN772_01170 [Solirubrobacteraceae bacterium]|nr:hypothetical protein [Solirubrobacteraceae bacterium]